VGPVCCVGCSSRLLQFRRQSTWTTAAPISCRERAAAAAPWAGRGRHGEGVEDTGWSGSIAAPESGQVRVFRDGRLDTGDRTLRW